VVGAIGQHKGYDRILACARDAAARDLPLEFVVIGYTEDDPPLFETGKTFVTGPFEDSEIDALLRREACDVGLLPSVWPETWCYALTHLLRSGLPLLAFDLGAMAERLSGVPRARLLPLDIEAPALNDALLAAARLRTVMNLKTRTAGLSADRPWIEAMRVDLAGVGPAGELAVGAIMAGEVPTPWAAGPDWARDPDGARPLTAFSVRLGGELAKVANCRYRGAFSSGWSVDAAAGEWCRSPMANDTLVSAEVTLDLIDG
jgi:hypothetical protein